MNIRFFPKKNIYNLLFSVTLLTLIPALNSCKDDVVYADGDIQEGIPVNLSLSFSVGDMTKLTRAADDEDNYKRVSSLWVGIYNATTSECTFKGMMSQSQNEFEAGVKNHYVYKLKNILTKSGKSYIVAVANPENYFGIADANGNLDSQKRLSELLNEADSWEKYKSIIVSGSVLGNGTIDVQAPTIDANSGLLMSGHYVANDKTDDPVHPNGVNTETAVNILPTATSLDGIIHLRRLTSHIRFNIKGTGNIVDLTPQSYQIHNVPYTSWLNEQSSGEYENAGDAILKNYNPESNGKCYKKSLNFASTYFDKTTADGTTTYSFDFWQMENKRTGLESCIEYNNREREYTETPGIFISLSNSNPVSFNNLATYVDIPCVVNYKALTSEGDYLPDDITHDKDLFDTEVTRTANITYRIHLGYVNKENNISKIADPRDFNCYRNSDYTYNITVSNLHNVIVEAFRDGDNQPGAFGEVTDTSHFFPLDAHPGVFNIYLSNDNLSNFSFRMITYYDNEKHEVTGSKTDGLKIDGKELNSENWKFYNWITFQYLNNNPETSTVRQLATYPGTETYDKYSSSDKKLLYMGDFIKETPLQQGWYTVFVSEYSYEEDNTKSTNYGKEDINKNWKKYVDQPDRHFWINVAQQVSNDGESTFYKAKFSGSQRSIQTYYDPTDPDVNTAIGVEHVNENFGMNIRWINSIVSASDLNADNGRFNVWNALGNQKKWETYMKDEWQNVNVITNNNVSGYVTTEQKNGGLRSVQQMETIPITNLTQYTNLNEVNPGEARNSLEDPQTTGNSRQFIQAMFSCMNRNRDENGNGTIDASELKWYLPASGKYLRVILGRNSLRTPIMSYEYNKLPFGAASSGKNGIYHLISSDNKVVWADEGLSTSYFYNKSATTSTRASAPWQVRCIRNLGTDLSIEPTDNSGDGVNPAYNATVKSSDHSAVVRVTRYLEQSLRNPVMETLPVHKTNASYNMLGRYGFEVAPRGNGNGNNEEAIRNYTISNNTISYVTASAFQNTLEGNPCATLNNGTKKGWRVPNQKEIAIMLRLGIFSDITLTNGNDRTNIDYYVISCTSEYWDNKGETSTFNLGIYRLAAARPISTQKVMTQIMYNVEALRYPNTDRGTYYPRIYLRCVRDLQAGE